MSLTFLINGTQIVYFGIVLVALILYIIALTMRSKNNRKNAYIMEVLAIILVVAYQIATTRFNFSWKSFDSVISGLIPIMFLAFMVLVLISKLFFRRK